jgi:dihydroorotate dehydrogenase (fumarate)
MLAMSNGAHHVEVVIEQFCAWLAEHDYESVVQLRGSVSQPATSDRSAFERSNYMKTHHCWPTTVAP